MMNTPTFADLLTATRDAAETGCSWEEAWNQISPDFETLAAAWTPPERARAFEAVLASFVSNDPMPIEPIGKYCFCGSKD